MTTDKIGFNGRARVCPFDPFASVVIIRRPVAAKQKTPAAHARARHSTRRRQQVLSVRHAQSLVVRFAQRLNKVQARS
jgi:hypothetical protein